MMIAGFTDSHYFRQKKLIAYGFIPIRLRQAETAWSPRRQRTYRRSRNSVRECNEWSSC